jgi:hypothetical protein
MRLLHEKTMLPKIIKATSSELAALQSTHTSTHLSLSLSGPWYKHSNMIDTRMTQNNVCIPSFPSRFRVLLKRENDLFLGQILSGSLMSVSRLLHRQFASLSALIARHAQTSPSGN